MLTEQEKKWLEERQNMDALAPCCRKQGPFPIYKEDCIDCNMFLRGVRWCPFSTDWRDAAVFEARVAKKLAEETPFVMRLGAISEFMIDAETALMLARLYIEQKMETEQC